jgi:hypothetical protein
MSCAALGLSTELVAGENPSLLGNVRSKKRNASLSPKALFSECQGTVGPFFYIVFERTKERTFEQWRSLSHNQKGQCCKQHHVLTSSLTQSHMRRHCIYRRDRIDASWDRAFWVLALLGVETHGNFQKSRL